MKKILLISLLVTLIFTMFGCQGKDKSIGVIDGAGEETVATTLYKGDGYSISIPGKGYHYEKDYDDGVLEEKWESITRDDVSIEVITYKHTDKELAQKMFLRENDDYIFEDLMGYPLCGMEPDGDTLWFGVYEANGHSYIVSWEYPGYTDEKIREELSAIAGTFKAE